MYALVEACIQFLFFITLNNFGLQRISILEYHLVMLVFQCVLIWPIWWVAWAARKQPVVIQVLINVAFYALYSWCWFGPVQDAVAFIYNHFQELTRPVSDRQTPYLDRGNEYSFLNYQLLKHAFRLSWFYLAAFFYNYRREEKKRIELAVANKELQLKMLKWHLAPSFYFKTIDHLQKVSADKPINATGSILQLAKVMEYVIYEAKEKWVDVKKEIELLNNYSELLNQQNNLSFIGSTVTGDYEKLKISPLTLAGLIDKIGADEGQMERISYHLQLVFSGRQLKVTISSDAAENKLSLLSDDHELRQRLTEQYPGRSSLDYLAAERSLQLTILLDEER